MRRRAPRGDDAASAPGQVMPAPATQDELKNAADASAAAKIEAPAQSIYTSADVILGMIAGPETEVNPGSVRRRRDFAGMIQWLIAGNKTIDNRKTLAALPVLEQFEQSEKKNGIFSPAGVMP